jgi:hypothetical protein|eukprot:COSAG01_NODE_1058_length_11898_cov_53.877871_6_plen_163_part_00
MLDMRPWCAGPIQAASSSSHRSAHPQWGRPLDTTPPPRRSPLRAPPVWQGAPPHWVASLQSPCTPAQPPRAAARGLVYLASLQHNEPRERQRPELGENSAAHKQLRRGRIVPSRRWRSGRRPGWLCARVPATAVRRGRGGPPAEHCRGMQHPARSAGRQAAG